MWVESRWNRAFPSNPKKTDLKAHEMIQSLPEELLTQMLDWFREHDRNVYRAAISSLAEKRRLRLVFIQKKPLPEQYAWAIKNLRVKQNEEIAEHLLRSWLMSGHQEMLAMFCDAMGIEHDGKGAVSGALADDLDAAALDAAVDQLLEKYDPTIVRIYLTMFNQQKPDGWAVLTKKLAEDERLQTP